MHEQCPQADPSHKGKVVGALGNDNVVDGVGKDRDGPRDAHDDERLRGEDGEDDAAQNRGEEHLVDAVRIVCLGEHVEREGQRGKDTGVVSLGWQDRVETGIV